jgi:hypothetical protein
MQTENVKTFLNVVQGEKKREDLFLPILYFPTVDPYSEDSWLNKIGSKSFTAWLQLLTLVDRQDSALEKYGNKNTVPNSIEGLAKLFKMSKPTFYKQVLKPLWNYGLIDLVEWKDQKKIGQKAINIIVYPYPQNNKELENKPLEKVRDYDLDYSSDAKTFSQKAALLRTKDDELDFEDSNRNENFTVNSKAVSYENDDSLNRKENFTVDRKESLTVDRKENFTQSYTNTLVNNSNALVNNQSKNINDDDDENNYIYIDLLTKELANHFDNYGIRNISVLNDCINYLDRNNFKIIHEHHTKLAIEKILDYTKLGGKYTSLGALLGKQIIQQHEQALGEAYLESQRIVKRMEEDASRVKPKFYNWLEEREDNL